MTNDLKTHTYEMLDGSTVEYVIGRNARENSQLVQEAVDSDIWFHAGDGISSCHVIAELPENHDFTERELLNIVKVGAGLCKQNTNKLRIMRKKMVAIALSSILLIGCGSSKGIDECCKEKTKTEVVSGENDPLMKLLLSGLIILSVNFLFTK